jgi:hypothetical protein
MGIYMQDYGGPIGNRLIENHPDWLQWQIIQNANSYEEGFTDSLPGRWIPGWPRSQMGRTARATRAGHEGKAPAASR